MKECATDKMDKAIQGAGKIAQATAKQADRDKLEEAFQLAMQTLMLCALTSTAAEAYMKYGQMEDGLKAIQTINENITYAASNILALAVKDEKDFMAAIEAAETALRTEAL